MTSDQIRAAFDSYLERLEVVSGLRPAPIPLRFDPVPAFHTAAWSLLGKEIVAGELSELTNVLNQWMGALRRWNAWNEVLADVPGEVRIGVEWELVEPLAFMCMFQPSAARDRFALIGTNALHQIRMARDPSAKDELLGDPKPPRFKKYHPRRMDKEKQLLDLAREWPVSTAFLEAHRQLDDVAYKAITSDFRNRASHAIAPCFSIGITSVVVRSRVPKTRMQEQTDGTFEVVSVPGIMATSYGYGGTPPLEMQTAWEANLAQFEVAKRCFDAYVLLLSHAMGSIPQRPHGARKSL